MNKREAEEQADAKHAVAVLLDREDPAVEDRQNREEGNIGLARRKLRSRLLPIAAPMTVGTSEIARSQYVLRSTRCCCDA